MTSERNGASQRSVLIVEDDPAVARILRVCLRRAGFDTLAVETGGEALKKMDEGRPDAVLLDLGLPDGLGGTVLNRLHERSPGWLSRLAHRVRPRRGRGPQPLRTPEGDIRSQALRPLGAGEEARRSSEPPPRAWAAREWRLSLARAIGQQPTYMIPLCTRFSSAMPPSGVGRSRSSEGDLPRSPGFAVALPEVLRWNRNFGCVVADSVHVSAEESHKLGRRTGGAGGSGSRP